MEEELIIEEDVPKVQAINVWYNSNMSNQNFKFDFKQYTFAPLLLYTQTDYFDSGYSNYNSVEEFFHDITNSYKVDMISNVLFDQRNMKYHELLSYVIKN
jgi:hypothetical protein